MTKKKHHWQRWDGWSDQALRDHIRDLEQHDAEPLTAQSMRAELDRREGGERLGGAVAALGEAVSDRDRQIVDLKVNSPNRSPADQKDAAHLPLFVKANEPELF